MTARDPDTASARAPQHIPVLLNDVLAAAQPADGQVIVDGTFGNGGYTRAFLDAGAAVIAIDRDPTAIAAGQQLVEQAAGRLQLIEGSFSELDQMVGGCGHAAVDAVVLDVGVSSMQIDQPGRGFSFQKDGPLDMRMSTTGVSAHDVVNTYSAKQLSTILFQLGEERRAPAIARAIDVRRRDAPIDTTLELAAVVESVLGRNPRDPIHPATRTFQAIRIFVNAELFELATALGAAERILKPGGRLVVVSFHSLEDRIVKRFLADRSRTESGASRHAPAVDVPTATFTLSSRRAITATGEETARNPRARSAKMRVGIRTEGAARRLDMMQVSVPKVGSRPPEEIE